MNLNIPGIKKSASKQKVTIPKINLSKGMLSSKLDIYKDKLLSLLMGKTLLYELISLNKKVIGILFAIGLVSSSLYSIYTNYDKFNRKVKQEKSNAKIHASWKKKSVLHGDKQKKLQAKYNKKMKGVYTLSTVMMEQALVQLFIRKMNRVSGKYMNLSLRGHLEDPHSNTLFAEISVVFKKPIMKVLLVSSLMEDGYFVEELTDTFLKIRKIKDKIDETDK